MGERWRWDADYLDKGCLAATSREHGVSNAPTWELVVEGALSTDAIRRGLAHALARFPIAAGRLRPADEGVGPHRPLDRAKRFAWVTDATATSVEAAASLVAEVTVTGTEELESLRRTVWDRFVDPTVDPPVRITAARAAGANPPRTHVFVQQHHAVADGTAFLAFLDALVRGADAAQEGEAPGGPGEEAAPVGRVDEAAPLNLTPAKRRWWTFLGALGLLGAVLRALARPARPLPSNTSLDYRGGNRVARVRRDAATLARWRGATRAAGVGLSAALTAALYRAVGRWARELGTSPGHTTAVLAASTRPRRPVREDGPAACTSFANHLAGLGVSWDLSGPSEPTALAARFHAQIARQVLRSTHIKRLLFERWAARGLPLGAMRRMVFQARRAAYNLNFSNLIPLPTPPLAGTRFRVRDLLVTTPCLPRTAVVLTAVRFGGTVTFNLNYKESALPPGAGPRLAVLLDEALDETFHALGADSAAADGRSG